jgi:hypothetical protein
MLTSTLRRLYIYIAAFIGLQMLAAGIIELIVFLGERWLGGVALGASCLARWASRSRQARRSTSCR